MPLISSERPRPPSEQLVDLHVYVVPTSAWNEQYRSVFNQAVNETVSAGFVRAHPEDPLYKLRDDVEEQLGTDIIPEEYVFLRSVGRCLTQVKGKQELTLKVKSFLPPYNFSAEIFVLKSKRESVPLPEINGGKEHLLERKYSRTEGTQTTQSTNSGYHSDDWSSNHVQQRSTGIPLANQHSIAGHTAPHSSHQPSNQGDNHSSSPHDTHSSFSSSGQQPLPPIATHKFPTPLHSNSPTHKETQSQQYDLTSGSQDSLPRFLSPEQNDHAFPGQEEEQSPRSQAPASNLEYKPPLSATPPDSPMFNVGPAHLTNQLEITEHGKPSDKPGWRDTYTNGTNEDSGIAEPTPEEGDLEFPQLNNSIGRHEVMDQHSEKGHMVVLNHSQEEPHRTEQRRRYNDNDSSKGNEDRTIHDFQIKYEKFLEDEENRKELEKLEHMREHNAQNVADVRRKKEEMQQTMSRRARELASRNSHSTKQYQADEIEPSERSSLASKEVSQYGEITAHDRGRLMDEQRDLNQEQWSDGQAPMLTEKELLQQLQKDEAEKNRRALEAIQLEDLNKEHSFLKKGQKRGIPSAVDKQYQDTLSNGRTSRPGQQTNQATKNKDCNQLLADLEEMREQRQAIEHRREDLVRKAKTLQSRTQDRRNKALDRIDDVHDPTRDYWKKQYFEEKKLTNPLEDHINKLRQQVEQAHRKLMVMMEGRIQGKKCPPSQKNNHKINIAKGQHDLEDLRRRVENAKMKLTSEMKLRNQAEKELRNLKNELTQKKIHVTLTRSQQLAILKESEEGLLSSRTPQPHRTPLPHRTPVVPGQLRQSLTSRP